MPDRSILIKPSAQIDINEAYFWYEANRNNLGAEFIWNLDAVLQAIKRHPEFAGFAVDNIRSAALQRFPFSVYYLIETDQIVVIAVLHHSRNPNNLSGRSNQ